jgi:N5-(cytidine 5'-diphosphoramidyl)-L-glutamine hydrolase
MPERLKVAVSQRVDEYPIRNEIRDAADQKLMAWIFHAGFIPVPVPNKLDEVQMLNQRSYQSLSLPGLGTWLEMIGPQAILLSGGNTVGEMPHRDQTEAYLLNWAERDSVPVLGICRGMQMMAVWAGGQLEDTDGHVRIRHRLTIESANIDFPETVNSYHDQRVVSVPESFDMTAVSEDGTIEAIRHQYLPWQGWMWHPEREVPFSQKDTDNLKKLFLNK